MRSLPYAEDRDRRSPRLLRERTQFQIHHADNDREIPDPERLYSVSQGQDYGVGNGHDESLVAAIAMDASVTQIRRLSWRRLKTVTVFPEPLEAQARLPELFQQS